jgi:hypothetical protein
MCFPRAYGPENNPICMSWWREGADVVFALQCVPDSFPYITLGWCAVGFSTASPPGVPVPQPGSWGMWPADVIHLQVQVLVPPPPPALAASAPAAVVLTDRPTTGVRLPACAAAQPTRLLNASLDSSSGVLTAYFARAAELPPELLALGFTNLNRTLPLVAAISNSGAARGGCGAVFPPHDNEWRNETASFVF